MLVRAFIYMVRLYRAGVKVSLPASCRFVPSCSEYAAEAVLKYGFLRGILKAISRLMLCHPLSGKSGYDPLI